MFGVRSSPLSLSAPVGPFSAHRLASSGRLWWLRLYSWVGLDVAGVEGESACQPLHVAAYNGEREVVQWLIQSMGVPVDVCTAEGWQAVHCAAAGGYLPTLQWLVEEGGASVNARTAPERLSPLMCSAITGQTSTVHFLVQKGGSAAVTAVSRDGHTPLHFAAARGSRDVLHLLLLALPSPPPSALPSVDLLDGQQRTPLHWAVRKGHLQCVVELLTRGASLTAKDHLGFTALTMAALHGWTDCMAACRDEGERRREGPITGGAEVEWRETLQLLEGAMEAEGKNSRGQGNRRLRMEAGDEEGTEEAGVGKEEEEEEGGVSEEAEDIASSATSSSWPISMFLPPTAHQRSPSSFSSSSASSDRLERLQASHALLLRWLEEGEGKEEPKEGGAGVAQGSNRVEHTAP